MFVPCHSSPRVDPAPTAASRSLTSHGKTGCSRRDSDVSLFDGACERAARIANGIDAGDEVEVNFDTGVITDVTKGENWQAAAFPPFIQNIIKAGGLLKSLKEREAYQHEL